MIRMLLALTLAVASPALARTVTDCAGRVVELPDEIDTVFAAGPPASVLVYMLEPETMTGWPSALYPEEEALHRRALSRPARDRAASPAAAAPPTSRWC